MRPSLSLLALAATLAPVCFCLLGSTPASAAYEQVGCFAGPLPGLKESCKPILPPPKSQSEFGEEVQLGGTTGMAVNYTGNGGVPAGTVYAATQELGGETRVAMFVPAPDGGLEFSQRWEVKAAEGAYARCGPALGTTCAPRATSGPGRVDVDVDQATGNVYVFNGSPGALPVGERLVVVYKPDGSEVITRFGEAAPSGKTTAETPIQVHEGASRGGIAVNGAGEVYVYDFNFSDGYRRLMKFRPKTPGKYDEYEYAGTSEDLGAGFSGQGRKPEKPVADAAGNVYVAPEQTHIEMYDPDHPGAPPVCDFFYSKGGITAITANPQTGEVFFFSYKAPKRVRRLGPCNPATGKFAESEPEPEAFTLAPERDDLYGLAFDPTRQVDPTRAPGVLYGAAPGSSSSNGVGEGEKDQSSLGYVFARVKEVAPKVEAESASHVTASGASLEAIVNPNGFDTDYSFQYLSAAEYEANPPGERFAGAKKAPPGGGTVKGGEGARNISTAIGGLQPDTEYRYRAVAVSECASGKACEGEGQAEAFRTFALLPPGLVDRRAYELVSPAQKSGGQVLPADADVGSCGATADCKPGQSYAHFPMQSAPNGDSAVYEGTSFDPEVGAAIENEYIARRDSNAGWQSIDLTPALAQREGRGYQAFDQSLDLGVLGQLGPALSPEAPQDYANLYAQPTDELATLRPLLTRTPSLPPSGSGSFELKYAGASSDLSRVFFKANDALTEATPFAPAAALGTVTQFDLYEWERATGQLRLVNVKPGNAETEAGATLGTPSAHGVSADGSRVFWSDQAGHVFLREDAEVTKAISDPGKFLSASADGSKVLLDDGCLYELQSETCEDLTLDQSETHKGGFKGIAGQSEDLSRVYFVDTEVLSGEEANSEGAKAQAGKFNLYAWSEEGPTRYVATLDAADNSGATITHTETWAALPSQRTAEASPGGGFLAFQSFVPLTGYGNTGPCGNDTVGGFIQAPCSEVFLYDSQSGELSCPSCNPTEAAPLGWSLLRLIRGGPETLPQPRYLTDEGRLYFDSRDTLSLADTNDGVEDVYEYEPQGIGTCKREAGCVSLISAGTGTVDSNFLAMDETGANVFFTSRDQLVLKDKDELIDLYDAREEGGIASETETQRPECQGEACQPVPGASGDPSLGSASVEGEGNVKAGGPSSSRCPKGRRKVQRKGKARCVKRHHRSRAEKHKRGRHQ